MVSPQRLALYHKVLAGRTRYLTVILENLFQWQNASAVLRSCECFGVQDVHVIENHNAFEVNPEIDMGASKWLTLHRYHASKNNTIEGIRAVKRLGYRIVATSPHADGDNLRQFNVNGGKFALLFGTERHGLTPQALALADEIIRIPMSGFVESFNISVAVAICLYELTYQIKNQQLNYHLDEDEAEMLLLRWLLLSVKNLNALEARFLNSFT